MTSDFFAALDAGAFFGFGDCFEGFAEALACDLAVVGEGAAVLAFHFDAGGDVLEENCRGCLVYLLPTGSGAFDEFFDEILFFDPECTEARLDGGEMGIDVIDSSWIVGCHVLGEFTGFFLREFFGEESLLVAALHDIGDDEDSDHEVEGCFGHWHDGVAEEAEVAEVGTFAEEHDTDDEEDEEPEDFVEAVFLEEAGYAVGEPDHEDARDDDRSGHDPGDVRERHCTQDGIEGEDDVYEDDPEDHGAS